MSSDLNRPLRLEITVNASQPQLLAGLDYWVRLGLLSDRQVKQLSQRYLTCTIPEPVVVVEKPKTIELPVRELEKIPVPILPRRQVATQKIVSSQPSGLEKILQSFKDELSLRWLFFLGIFLVIVSSGVMTATQWQEISSIGQYGILYIYTLIFGIAGWWTGKDEKLKLTSQTLKIVALLLIPINFVAMDSFGLWRNFLGGLTIAIATISLSILPFLFSRKAIAIEASLFLGLCYLNWGWNFTDFPLLAIYLGTIPTAFLLRRKLSNVKKVDPSQIFFLIFALSVLLVRGLIIEQIPLSQLGLAIGIGGWLCTEISPFLKNNTVISKYLEIIGIIFISLGWEVGLGEDILWQSLAVSSLGFLCFLKRLKRCWYRVDLLALFAIGAQGLILLFRLAPVNFWDRFLATLVELTGYQYIAIFLAICVSFSYSFIFIGCMEKLYRLDKLNLAYFGEGLALALAGLTCLAASLIPPLRSLSLGLWTISFIIVAHRFTVRPLTIYLAHISGTIAIFSLCPWLFPQLAIENYGIIFLIWAIAEWIVFMGLEKIKIARFKNAIAQRLSIWSLSCWYLGFIGAIGSYFCASISQVNSTSLQQYFVWLVVPLLLTLVSGVGHPRSQKAIFSYCGEGLALILGGTTCFLIYFSPALLSLFSLSLFFWTISFLIIAHRATVRPFLIYLAHLSGAIATLSLFPWLFPQVAIKNYDFIVLIWAIAEWIAFMGLEKIQISDPTKLTAQRLSSWSLSCWHWGFLGAICSYLFLSIPQMGNAITPERALVWLLVPLTLTVISRVSPPRIQEAAIASTIALFASQYLLIEQPVTRLVGFGVATGLGIANTRAYKRTEMAWISIGYALGLGAVICWPILALKEWFVAGAIAAVLLVGFHRFLKQREEMLAQVYREAADIWALALTRLLLCGVSLTIAAGYGQFFPSHWALFIAPIILTGAIALRGETYLNNAIVWEIAWGIEAIVSGGLLLANASLLILAAANILLGFVVIGGSLWGMRSRLASVENFSFIALLYTFFGLGLRWGYFNEYTGLLTLGAALIGLAIGSHRPSWRGLSYLSLAGISIALYELTIYQMTRGSGGSPVDGLTILAMVAIFIAIAYRGLTFVMKARKNEIFSNLRRIDLIFTGNIHWAIASLLMLAAILSGLDFPSKLRLVGTIICGILPLYAIVQGRGFDRPKIADFWVILGILEAGLLAIYFRLFWPEFMVLGGAVVPSGCAIALAFYSLPWNAWGWRKQPWQYCAIALPPLVLFSESTDISTLNLLIIAAFYLRVAQQSKNWRWSYFALGFCNWAIARFFQNNQFQDPLWYVSLASLSIIYIAQFDPSLQGTSQSKNRHLLRVMGSSLTSVVALVLHSENGLIPCAIGLLAVFIGLGVKVRAFLYVGTITFLLATLYQLIVLIFQYAFLKWVIGLITGIILIIVAANFERSRDRVSSTWQNWLAQLETWQ